IPIASRLTCTPPAGSVATGSRGFDAIVSGSKTVMSATLPAAMKPRSVMSCISAVLPVSGVWPAAAVAGADHRVLRAEDVLLHFRIMVAVDRLEASLQILVERQIEEGVHDALVLLFRDLLDALAFEMAVLPLRRHEHLDEVPAAVEQTTGAATPVGHAA